MKTFKLPEGWKYNSLLELVDVIKNNVPEINEGDKTSKKSNSRR